MVPADDTQEPEPTAPQITTGDQPPRASVNNSARLTPMPSWLMHWWTPIAIAEGLLRWPLMFAIFWGGHPHWPSSEAMKLCITIVGAGLAFSAWQQRTHDNARMEDDRAQAQRKYEAEREEREQIRVEQIERDEYWKRREHILHTLDSNNPRIRLAAISLLAELADKAEDSSVLNDKEKQQLQRHIIDTLCLQVRHEGLCIEEEGDKREHTQIQATIFETILKRIDVQRNRSLYANWSKEPINITYCTIHTPVLIQNITTDAVIDFSQSKFLSTFELSNVTITTLLWERAYFVGELITRNNSTIGIRSLPQVSPYCRYINTTIMHESETFSITLRSYKNYEIEPEITLSNCKFISKSTNDATPVQIYTTHDESNDRKAVAQNLRIYRCQLADITIDATYIHSRILIEENNITGPLQIDLAEQSNEDGILERTPHASDRIQLRSNVIHPGEDDMPIAITNRTDTNITNLIKFYNNCISRDNAPEEFHTLEHEILKNNPKPFLFSEITSAGNVVHSWKTGGEHEDLDLFSWYSILTKSSKNDNV